MRSNLPKVPSWGHFGTWRSVISDRKGDNRRRSAHFEDSPRATLREVLFSVLIVGVMYAIGFLIASRIEKWVDDNTLKYRQAVQIKDDGAALTHASDTDVGYAFVEGDFKALDPVSCEGLEGEYLFLRRDKEEYTKHTRTVTYTVMVGKTHVFRTRVKTYWTWDVVKRDSWSASKVEFCGNEYARETFRYTRVPKTRTVVDTGFNKRDVYYHVTNEFRGTVFCDLRDGKVNGEPDVMFGKGIESAYTDMTSSCAVTVFWVMWWILTAGAVVGVCIIDNRWLEDEDE